MKKFFVVIACIGLLVSCKDEKKTEKPAEAVVEVTGVENFRVELDVNASKKDDFTVYYTENNTIDFTGDLAQWRGVEGGKEETIVIDLPKDVIPTDIRLDFGMNKQQEYVIVKNIKLIYHTSDFSIKGSDFFKYFIEDKNFKTEIDPTAGTLKILPVGTTYTTPYFYPTQQLLDAIKELTK